MTPALKIPYKARGYIDQAMMDVASANHTLRKIVRRQVKQEEYYPLAAEAKDCINSAQSSLSDLTRFLEDYYQKGDAIDVLNATTPLRTA